MTGTLLDGTSLFFLSVAGPILLVVGTIVSELIRRAKIASQGVRDDIAAIRQEAEAISDQLRHLNMNIEALLMYLRNRP